ncbi:MAG TPA: hypothetical protein DDW65_01010 [Firmicutes bacterium]|jgi:hypothetical protein|nr:hypothetical protein [Bacillota bacterium]
MVIHEFKIRRDTGEIISLSITPVVEFWDKLDPVPEVLNKMKAIGFINKGQFYVMLSPDLKDQPDEVTRIVKALVVKFSENHSETNEEFTIMNRSGYQKALQSIIES